MKIKILTSCAGLDFSYSLGETVEVTQKLGDDLVSGGLAEEIKTAAKPKAGAKKDAAT